MSNCLLEITIYTAFMPLAEGENICIVLLRPATKITLLKKKKSIKEIPRSITNSLFVASKRVVCQYFPK
jgi:hypothetical protein